MSIDLGPLFNAGAEAGMVIAEKRAAREIAALRAALKPFADLADRETYTLDDIPHELCINAKLALRGLRVVGGIVQQQAPSPRDDFSPENDPFHQQTPLDYSCPHCGGSLGDHKEGCKTQR